MRKKYNRGDLSVDEDPLGADAVQEYLNRPGKKSMNVFALELMLSCGMGFERCDRGYAVGVRNETNYMLRCR